MPQNYEEKVAHEGQNGAKWSQMLKIKFTPKFSKNFKAYETLNPALRTKIRKFCLLPLPPISLETYGLLYL
jgi:hypothetical protein